MIGIRDVGESLRSVDLVEEVPLGLSVGICDWVRFGILGGWPGM